MSELALTVFAAERERHAVPGELRSGEFERFARSFDVQRYLQDLQRAGVGWVSRRDRGFPPRLAAIHDPPPGLFLRGEVSTDMLSRPSIAVVGARSCSDYGAHVARSLARALAAAGVVVVSGLARGVDGWAHRGALDAGGATVAVLGCGIDRDYPAAHAALARQVATSGLIVSEYPPGVPPAPWRFPARNRIVAGLAAAVVVVEAREKSGALITADLALEEGRDVLAVPGEITSALSDGTNSLIRLGAVPVTGPQDVLDVLGLVDRSAEAPTAATGNAALALAAVEAGAATADEVSRLAELSPGEAAAALVELELAGLLESTAGIYRR